MMNAEAVANLGKSTPCSESSPLGKRKSSDSNPEGESNRKKIFIEFVFWFFGIFISFVTLALPSLGLLFTGETVNFVENVLFSKEVIFIAITACVSMILEYDKNKPFDVIMFWLNIIFIIIGVYTYGQFADIEYDSIIQALTVERTLDNAKECYKEIPAGNIFCIIYFGIMFFLGLIKHVQKFCEASS